MHISSRGWVFVCTTTVTFSVILCPSVTPVVKGFSPRPRCLGGVHLTNSAAETKSRTNARRSRIRSTDNGSTLISVFITGAALK
jgi:hypothetical protein